MSSGDVAKVPSADLPPAGHSAHTADIHEEHEDTHRHHSVGFHGTPHIAEHLAAATGRDFAHIQAKAIERSRGRVQEQPVLRNTKHLKPMTMTPVQAVIELSSQGDSEDPMPPGHPTHEKRKGPATIKDSQRLQLDSSSRSEPERSGQSNRLRHVESRRFDKIGEDSQSNHFVKRKSVEQYTTSAHSTGSRRQQDQSNQSIRHIHSHTTEDESTQAVSRNKADYKIRRFESAQFRENLAEGNVSRHGNDQNSQTEQLQQQHSSATVGSSRMKSGQQRDHPISPSEFPVHAKKTATNKISSWQQRIEEEGQKRLLPYETKSTDREKYTVPSARVSSPPRWLRYPQKEPDQRWIHQKLRHVSSHNPHDAWRSHQFEIQQPPRRSRSTIHEGREPLRLSKLTPVTERARQLEKPMPSSLTKEESNQSRVESGTEDWAGYLGIRSDTHSSRTQRSFNAHKERKFPKSPVAPSPLATPRLTIRVPHYAEQSQNYNEASTPMPSHIMSADKHMGRVDHVDATSIDEAKEYLEEFRRQSQQIQELYRQVSVQAEAELNRLRVEKTRARRESSEQASSSRVTASGFSTPSQILQPLHFPVHRHLHETTSGSCTSDFASKDRETLKRADKPSDLDLHRPSAIAPPNHECGWKERYMALTSEIRQLKAEIASTTHGQTIEHKITNEDMTLGIEGLTIVMHLKDKDDLVINTDLTQETEE